MEPRVRVDAVQALQSVSGQWTISCIGSLELAWSLVKQKSSAEAFMEHSSIMKASPQKGGSWLCSTGVLYVLCPKYVVSSVIKKLSLINLQHGNKHPVAKLAYLWDHMVCFISSVDSNIMVCYKNVKV